MSDDAIQDLLDEASTYATAATSFRTIQRAQEQHRATLATFNSLQEYIKAERDARFCTSDAVQDLFDQLFMQCMDCVPEYANFIKAAEEQHAKNLATIAELRSALEGRAAEVAELKAALAQLAKQDEQVAKMWEERGSHPVAKRGAPTLAELRDMHSTSPTLDPLEHSNCSCPKCMGWY